MKLVIDTNELCKLGLTFNQYFLAYCIANKSEKELSKYIKHCSLFSKNDVKKLEEKDLLFNINKDEDSFLFSNFLATDLLDKHFKNLKKDDFTNELLLVFPKKTPNGRRLTQVLKKDIEALYIKCHNENKEEHEKIIKLLKLEIENRTQNNSLDYMQNIKTWLRNMSYKAYEDDLNNSSEDITKMHGTKLF